MNDSPNIHVDSIIIYYEFLTKLEFKNILAIKMIMKVYEISW